MVNYGGTGLGLWITKQIIRLMSGFIKLRSEPQVGTRFTITLPFDIVVAENSSNSSIRLPTPVIEPLENTCKMAMVLQTLKKHNIRKEKQSSMKLR